MLGRWPFLVFAGLVVASLLSVGVLGRTVFSDLRALATAQNDDVSWTMSQLEVELLGLQNAILATQHSQDIDLDVVRERFDIFYSRVATFRQSGFYRSLTDDDLATSLLTNISGFLESFVTVIDAEDAFLVSNLPFFEKEVRNLRPDVRTLALAGVDVFSRLEAARRAELSGTLQRAALGLVFLICLLVFAVGILITLFRQGQRFARANEVARSRYEAAIASSLDAVLVVDTRGRIVEFNGAAEAVFGFSRDEALGAEMADLMIPKPMRKAHRDGMRRFLNTGEAKVLGKGRVRLEGMRKSGEIFPVELSISSFQANNERFFVSYLRDITADLVAEKELRSALAAAQESEKAKSDLLTVMSHEMRTPLNGILGSLELFEQTNLSVDQRQHLNAIAVSGELLLSHVNDVLDLSEISAASQKVRDEVFNLEKLVQTVTDSLHAHATARGNHLSVEFLTDELQWVKGNSTALQRCLVNLVGNAIKFTEQGAVSVEVERLNSSEVVELRIADTGVGVAPENLKRIFEEFVTVDTAYDRTNAGTGLGLAITKGLVEEMRGFISADSELGEGSLFTMRLPFPLVPRHEMPQESVSDAGLPALPKEIRCLVVDDNKINRVVLAAILQDLGGEVVEATSGFEAIEIAKSGSFDLILMDISMPGIDGIETLRRIRDGNGAAKDATAIAVTAHASKSDHQRILAADFHQVLVKPLNRKRVHQLVATVFGLSDELTDVQEADVPEFLERFGEDKFRAALGETLEEIDRLILALNDNPQVSEAHREEAHRLSGSAAILGQQDLWSALQDIQNVSDQDWPDARRNLVSCVTQVVEQTSLEWR